MRAIPLLTVLLLAPLSDAITQEQPLQPGQRVRVTVPDLGITKQAATFDALESGTLVVTADTTMRYPLASVTRLETYAGRHSHPWRGAGIGSLAGWAIGFGLWHAADVGCYEGVSQSACAAVLGGGVGAASGALLGALVGGFLWKTDKWEEVQLDRLRVSFVPRRDGFALGFSVAF